MPLRSVSREECILVIDDSTEMLTLDRIVLESAGYQVHTSSSGEEALQIIDKINKIDLVLLDYNLPDMNGRDFITLLEKFKSDFFKTTPIVFHTGMDSLDIGKATGIIPKVTEIKIFLRDINHYIEMSRFLKMSN